MMIIAGYAAAFAWAFLMIFVLGGPVARRTNLETSRKLIHTSLFAMWVFIDLFLKGTVHQIILPAAFLVLNALSYKFKFYKAVEREEDNHPGTIYFAIAVTAIMTVAYFVPETYICTGIACFCLTFGDGFAALVGYNVKSPRIRGNKSWAGFAACFAASCFAIAVFRLIYMETLTIADCVLIAAVCAVSELTGSGCDNFTVTFSTFAAGMLLKTADARIAMMWALLIFGVVFFSKAITYYGALLAAVMVFIFRYTGGREAFLYFAGCYFTVFAIGIVRARVKGRNWHEGRGFKQIAINGGLGTVLMICYGVTGEKWLLISAVVSIGGNFIDSVSSDAGCMSKRKPYDFLRREYVETGLSGGMSLLGTVSALICSTLIGFYTGFVFETGFLSALTAGVIVFAQTLLDSCMGSRLQNKNRCTVCGAVTEDAIHCGSSAEHLRGIEWMDNNAVNLVSSVIITALAALVFKALL